MMSRVWHGWAKAENADAYESLLRERIFPSIERVAGYRGGFVLRRPVGEEVEFVTITRFDSLDAVKAFAGEDYELAVVLPEADALLERYDERSTHYETVVEPA
jgi:antibiotic biosynthesis monooxygenase (ABM) superfamily enzyme